MTLQNSMLANMVREHFQKDSRLSAQCIDVEVSGRDVTIMGCVDSPELKQTAEEMVQGVPGVRHVENHLVVHRRPRMKAA